MNTRSSLKRTPAATGTGVALSVMTATDAKAVVDMGAKKQAETPWLTLDAADALAAAAEPAEAAASKSRVALHVSKGAEEAATGAVVAAARAALVAEPEAKPTANSAAMAAAKALSLSEEATNAAIDAAMEKAKLCLQRRKEHGRYPKGVVLRNAPIMAIRNIVARRRHDVRKVLPDAIARTLPKRAALRASPPLTVRRSERTSSARDNACRSVFSQSSPSAVSCTPQAALPKRVSPDDPAAAAGTAGDNEGGGRA